MGNEPAGSSRLSREGLRAELERARSKLEALEADGWKSSDRLIGSLAAHMSEGLSLLSATGVQLDVNPALCAMVGFSREELVGHGIPQPFSPPEDRDENARRFARLIGSSEASIEATFMRNDGERFPVLVTPTVMRDETGEPFCVLATIKDMTELKRAEAALQASEEKYRDLFDNVEMGMFRTRLDGSEMLDANPRCLEIFGRTREEVIGAPSVVHWAEPDERQEMMRGLEATGRVTDFECCMLNKQGEVRTCLTSLSLDRRRGILEGSLLDITGRKRGEDALRESEARFRSLFEDSPVAMWEEDESAVKEYLEGLSAAGVPDVIAHLLADPREYEHCIALTRTIDVNKAAVRLFEADSRGDLMARNGDLYRRESDRGIWRLWEAMLAGKGSVTFEEANLSLRGREIQVLETCTVVPGHEDSYDRVYIADVDISERKRGEEALLRGEARLQRALSGTVAALGATVAMRDPYTASHERRVAWLACRIAERLGWSEEAIDTLRTAALVHDIGKITVPAEILSKPTRLTEMEFALVKVHASAAYDILAPIDFGVPVAEIVAQHHERLDGSGYPHGLAAGEILPAARVLAVADVVEAMITHRPYRPALPLEEALAEIGPGSRGRFDADAAQACRELFDGGATLPD
jgi:PAS domain S-box-containing protein